MDEAEKFKQEDDKIKSRMKVTRRARLFGLLGCEVVRVTRVSEIVTISQKLLCTRGVRFFDLLFE